MPGLENRMKVLKEIASENGIVLQLDEAASVSVEVCKGRKYFNIIINQPFLKQPLTVHGVRAFAGTTEFPKAKPARS